MLPPALGVIIGILLGTSAPATLSAISIAGWITLGGDALQAGVIGAQLFNAIPPSTYAQNAEAAMRLQPGMGPH